MHEAFEAVTPSTSQSQTLYIVSLFWLKDMDGLFAYYSKLSTSVDPTDFGITSVLQTVGRPIGLSQENIDLNVLSVTIGLTDICAPADCHYRTNSDTPRRGTVTFSGRCRLQALYRLLHNVNKKHDFET